VEDLKKHISGGEKYFLEKVFYRVFPVPCILDNNDDFLLAATFWASDIACSEPPGLTHIQTGTKFILSALQVFLCRRKRPGLTVETVIPNCVCGEM